MRPTRHRFTIPPEIQGRIAGGDLRLLVSSGLPVLEDAAPFSPISDPKIVGQFLLLCGSPRVMQLGLNVETGEVGVIWPWAPPCFANSSLSLYADSITAFAEGLPYDADEEGYPDNILAQADGLRRRIARIDPPAIGDNTFWNEISWDVVNGEWSSED